MVNDGSPWSFGGILSLCGDLEKNYFPPPFCHDMGVAQPKSGWSLLTLRDWAWRGAMGQFNVGEVVTCIPMISRSAALGDYKIIGEMRNEMATVCIGSKVHSKNTSGS